jgi:hypothetical protein
VIDFEDLSLDEAKHWPDLITIVEEEVKKDREKPSYASAPWWTFWRARPELYAAVRPLARCLVCSRHSKHLAFSFQSPAQVFADSLCVFAFDRAGPWPGGFAKLAGLRALAR